MTLPKLYLLCYVRSKWSRCGKPPAKMTYHYLSVKKVCCKTRNFSIESVGAIINRPRAVNDRPYIRRM